MNRQLISQKIALPERNAVSDSTGVQFDEAEIEGSLIDRFEQQVKRHANRLAIREQHNCYTYRALNGAANVVAHSLIAARGTGEGRVGLLFETSAAAVIGQLGALKAGKTCVALDPTFPTARLQSMISDADTDVIVTKSEFSGVAAELGAGLVIDIDTLDGDGKACNPEVDLSPDSLAAIVYTSGSTGRPKGVMQTHRVLLHRVWADTQFGEITCEDRQSMLLSLTFGAGFPDVLAAVLNGAALFPFSLKKRDLLQLADWLEQEEITIFTPPIAAFRQFERICPPGRKFPRCRLVNLAGEAAYGSDVSAFKRLFESDRCRLINILAASEAQIMCRYSVGDADHSVRILPVGYAESDKKLRVVNSEGNDVPRGDNGELVVRSRYLSPGYWRRPDLTQAAFESDADGSISFRTRDLVAIRADGCVAHRGRIDSAVKLRGYRIEPAEVEAALLGIDAVRAAAVTARRCQTDQLQLVAFVVLNDGASVSAADVRHNVSLLLPDYMIPSQIVFLNELPRTTNGKIDRFALKRLAIDADRQQAGTGESKKEPQIEPGVGTGEIERRIREIWQAVLGVENVGVNDDFFDLGGDSLSMVSMVTELKLATGREFPVQSLLHRPTIKGLVEHVQRSGPPISTVALSCPSGRALERRPIFCVLGLYLYKHLANALASQATTYGIFLESEIASLRPDSNSNRRYLSQRSPLLQLPTCEELASAYIEEIRRVQRRGPYQLVGSSYGGVIAFEMARQLDAMGEQVSLLAMLDSFAPGFRRPNGIRGWASLVRQWLMRFVPRRMPGRGSSRQAWDKLRGLGRSESMRKYRPAPYAGNAVLFKAKQPVVFPGFAIDDHLGWKNWIHGDLIVEEIPGDHLGILAPPNVQHLAATIASRLDRRPWRNSGSDGVRTDSSALADSVYP